MFVKLQSFAIDLILKLRKNILIPMSIRLIIFFVATSTLRLTNRPKSLAISTPTKLLTLEEARKRALGQATHLQEYIEVGGGPSKLPEKYHTVIELPGGARKRDNISLKAKRSPLGWRSIFGSKVRATGSVRAGKLTAARISAPMLERVGSLANNANDKN